jgi:hypothetical protein
MMDFPSKTSSKGNNQLSKVHLCNRGKGFNVVNTFLLRKSLRNKEGFMSLNNTFRGKLGHVDPSTLHNVLSLQLGN